MESKARIIPKTLEVYAQSLFGVPNSDTPDVIGTVEPEAIRESERMSGQARIRCILTNRRLTSPTRLVSTTVRSLNTVSKRMTSTFIFATEAKTTFGYCDRKPRMRFPLNDLWMAKLKPANRLTTYDLRLLD